MTIHNAEIVDDLYRLAELLEIEGANEFRVRAYRNAARTISELPESIASMVESGANLAEISTIGKDLAGKLVRLVETGHLDILEEEQRKLPLGLLDMTTLPGLGPKHVKQLHEILKIDNLDDLAKAASEGKLHDLPRFGQKLEQKILDALRSRTEAPMRVIIARAEEIGEAYLAYLKAHRDVGQALIAGSYRRRKDTVGDLDLLATSDNPDEVIEYFTAYPEIKQVMSKGPTRSTVLLRTGLQVDLRVVAHESFGAALHYFTGSKPHNIAIRRLGMERGLKINEYGVFKGEKRVSGRTEDEVYQSVGLPYIAPELREDRGEVEAAQHNRLPHLITLEEIRGDLHMHTTDSDGRSSLEEMVLTAKQRGYAYAAITDHTKHLAIARGLDDKRRRQQMEQIDRINEHIGGIRILKSAEVDILEDGRLDLSDSILKELDFTVCSVHYKFELSLEKQTERIIRAMDNPYFDILGHPTGRLINERAPYEVDMEKIIRAAKEHGCFLELNSQPDRLDLNEIHARMAKDVGVLVSISTDSHSAAGLANMRFGIGQARRGWLEAKDVLNTRTLGELTKLFKRR